MRYSLDKTGKINRKISGIGIFIGFSLVFLGLMPLLKDEPDLIWKGMIIVAIGLLSFKVGLFQFKNRKWYSAEFEISNMVLFIENEASCAESVPISSINKITVHIFPSILVLSFNNREDVVIFKGDDKYADDYHEFTGLILKCGAPIRRVVI